MLKCALIVLLVGGQSTDVEAKGGSSFSGGSRSFSSGGSFGRSSSSGSGSGFFKPSSPSPAPKPTYTPPAPRPSSPPVSAPAPKPSAPTPVQQTAKQPEAPKASGQEKFFAKSDKPEMGQDKRAIDAQKHADSAKAFKEAQDRKALASAKSQSPTPSSGLVIPSTKAGTVPTGAPTATVYDFSKAREARDRHTDQIASRIAQGYYRDREVRSQRFYGSSYNQPMPTYYGGGYHDSFDNPYFWYWLFNRTDTAERDRFIYNRMHDIDPQRMNALRTAYPDLSTQLDSMRLAGERVDTTYVPRDIRGQEDLMYGERVLRDATKKASEVNFLGYLSLVLLGLAAAFSLWYFMFHKKYQVKEAY
jgi:hypothetical protein